MKSNSLIFLISMSAITLVGNVLLFYPAHGALLNKSYVVKDDQGTDILCDAYTVQKNDWVWKLFRQRGEIAEKDFPEFQRIFKQINPQVSDIHTIHPGQDILIPLKKLNQDALPGQSTGIVTLPFVTISDEPEIPGTDEKAYVVRKGDTVYRLIAERVGTYGTKPFRDGVERFKTLNPNVADLNRIDVGQRLRLPDPVIRKKRWYGSMLDTSGRMDTERKLNEEGRSDTGADGAFVPYESKAAPKSPISRAAQILGAKLLKRGHYYFPKQGKKDLKLDLSRYPVLQFKEDLRMLIVREKQIEKRDLKSIKGFWTNMEIVSVPADASEEQLLDSIFSIIGKDPGKNRVSFFDNGVEVEVRARWLIKNPFRSEGERRRFYIMLVGEQDEPTPDSLSRYLKQHGIVIKDIYLGDKSIGDQTQVYRGRIADDREITAGETEQRRFINNLVSALGYRFDQNVGITFPYAEIQVEAVSNLISLSDGSTLLVDFEYFYGDSIPAIKKAGLDIVQVKAQDTFQDITIKLLQALKRSYSTNPTFLAAKRPIMNNISLTIPGFLVTNPGGSKALLSSVPLDKNIIRFLFDKQIKIVMIGS